MITDDDRRGAQIFAQDLHTEMGSRGWQSIIVGLNPGHVGGLDVRLLGQRRLSLATLWRLRREMRKCDITVAHGSTCVYACAIGRLVGGGPFVVRQISETSFWVDSAAKKVRVWLALSLARTIVCLAPSAAVDLLRTVRVRAAKVRLAANGLDGETFIQRVEARRSTARQELNLPSGEFVILSIGALTVEKAVNAAIEAVASLPCGTLLIVGDGPKRSDLEALASSLIPQRSQFLGSITEPVLAYAAADIVMLSSAAGDSMPAVLIEAGFAGLASVATDVGAVSDTIVDGLTGILVPPNDPQRLVAAMRRIQDDAELRRFMGSNARRYCLARFDISHVTDRWIAVLTEATS